MIASRFSTTNRNDSLSKWQTIGASEIAPNRIQSKSLNQDAVRCEVSDEGRAFFLAVADGHGAEPYFRSHIGSQLAVEASWFVAMKYLSGQYRYDQIPIQLENHWRLKVADHYFAAQLTVDELQINRSPNIYEIYGTTLLFVVAKQGHLVAVRFGDGDIVSVTRDGMASPLFPLPGKSSATNSLAQPNSFLNAELTTKLLDDGALPLLMASTDGVSDGCASGSDFMSIIEQLHLMSRCMDVDSIESELRQMLARVNGLSDGRGSHDDATLALAYQEYAE